MRAIGFLGSLNTAFDMALHADGALAWFWWIGAASWVVVAFVFAFKVEL